jgi:hypothetical protein
MNIYHPLSSIPEGAATWLVFAALVVLFLVTGKLASLNLDATKFKYTRIIALERPRDAKVANEVIGEWRDGGKLDEVHRCLRWDNVFIVVYSTLAALGCVIAARAFFSPNSTGRNIALLVAWLPWFAGLLDYVENYAMSRMLGGFVGESLPRLAWWCATTKFAIILTLGAWGIVGVLCEACKELRARAM